jgi:hypothetical protein
MLDGTRVKLSRLEGLPAEILTGACRVGVSTGLSGRRAVGDPLVAYKQIGGGASSYFPTRDLDSWKRPHFLRKHA